MNSKLDLPPSERDFYLRLTVIPSTLGKSISREVALLLKEMFEVVGFLVFLFYIYIYHFDWYWRLFCFSQPHDMLNKVTRDYDDVPTGAATQDRYWQADFDVVNISQMTLRREP